MKTLCTLFAAAGLALSGVTVFSQAPAPEPPVAPGTPLALLRAIRDQNVKLLQQQTETLKKLEEMEKTSEQIKAFSKRS